MDVVRSRVRVADQEYVFDPMFRLPVSLECVHTNSTILCHIRMEDLSEEKA